MRPMPFWPSLEPWKKLTPVQVRTRRPRIQGGGGLSFSGARVELGPADELLGQEQQQPGTDEADDGRDEERGPDLFGLGPIDALAEFVAAVEHRVGEAHTHDGTDEGVRARGREPEVPGAEVPDDGGDEQCEHHRESRARADIHHQLHREERQDREGHGAGGGEDAEKVPDAGPHHGDGGLQGVGIDDGGHGVGRVVKAVDELEAEREAEREQQEDAGSRRNGIAEEVHAGLPSF